MFINHLSAEEGELMMEPHTHTHTQTITVSKMLATWLGVWVSSFTATLPPHSLNLFNPADSWLRPIPPHPLPQNSEPEN